MSALLGNPYLLGVASFWLIFGLSEFLVPQSIQFVFDLALRRPRVVPVIRLLMGVCFIKGAVLLNRHVVPLSALGLFFELIGAIEILLPEDKLRDYLYWLRRRPKLTFRLMGMVNAGLALLILMVALS